MQCAANFAGFQMQTTWSATSPRPCGLDRSLQVHLRQMCAVGGGGVDVLDGVDAVRDQRGGGGDGAVIEFLSA